MSKIIARILENVTWLDELSAILTVFFILLFIFIVVSVLRLKKDEVDEFKRIPLNENDNDQNSN
jgi:cbb3-type cytochrome oxidase subunit 3